MIHARAINRVSAAHRAVGIALAVALAAAPAQAAVVAGRLGTGRTGAPALRVYAWAPANGHLYSVASGTAQSYSLDLPPGRYWLFAGLDGPGAPPIYAAYTDYTRCLREPKAGAACNDHDLAEVEVGKRARSGIDLTDWALDDSAATAIDGVLGRAPGDPYDESSRAAPKFTEYPARNSAEPQAAAAPPAGYHDADRDELNAARRRGPNFAGRLNFVPVSCGPGCAGVAFYDPRSGQVRYPAVLNPTALGTLVQYQLNSRLLIVHGAGTAPCSPVARYYTVDVDTLELKLITSRPAAPDPDAHCTGGDSPRAER